MPVSAWVMLFVILFIYIGGLLFGFSKIKSTKDNESGESFKGGR